MVPSSLGSESPSFRGTVFDDVASPWTEGSAPVSDSASSVSCSFDSSSGISDDSSSTWTVSIYSGGDAIFEARPEGGWTKYVYAAGRRLARIDCTAANPPTCTTKYYLSDHLGSTRKMYDAARAEVVSTEYEPFGRLFNTFWSEPYKFTGERHDTATGLVYLRARQYDPDLGRFVSTDPILGSLSALQTLNRYTHVVSNLPQQAGPDGPDDRSPSQRMSASRLCSSKRTRSS